jgi:hypothetical protein
VAAGARQDLRDHGGTTRGPCASAASSSATAARAPCCTN